MYCASAGEISIRALYEFAIVSPIWCFAVLEEEKGAERKREEPSPLSGLINHKFNFARWKVILVLADLPVIVTRDQWIARRDFYRGAATAASHNIVIHGAHSRNQVEVQRRSGGLCPNVLTKKKKEKKERERKKHKEELTAPRLAQLADVIVNNFSRGNRASTRACICCYRNTRIANNRSRAGHQSTRQWDSRGASAA